MSIIGAIVFDTNEAVARTVEQVRQVLAGIHVLEFRPATDDEVRCAWIGQVLSRLGYRRLGRADRGVALANLRRFGDGKFRHLQTVPHDLGTGVAVGLARLAPLVRFHYRVGPKLPSTA